jgi:hypothetical protein
MNVVNEIITKFQYLEKADETLLKTFIIKFIMKETLTKTLLDNVKPDHDVLYILYIKQKSYSQEFMACNFMFREKLHGFISYDGDIVYTMHDSNIIKHDESKMDDNDELVDWYVKKSPGHQLINYNGLFYLS